MGNKWTESQAAATARYREKNYKRFTIDLKLDDDKDVIESLQYAMDDGITKREWLSNIFHYGGNPKEVVPDGLVKKSDVEKVLMQSRIDYRIVKQIMDAL